MYDHNLYAENESMEEKFIADYKSAAGIEKKELKPPPAARKPGGAPQNPPPNFTPQISNAAGFAENRGRLSDYVFIWRKNSLPFWLYPTFIDGDSIKGYRWTDFGWVYSETDAALIDNLFCMPK